MSDHAGPASKVRDLAAHAARLPLLPGVIRRVLALNSASDGYFDDLVNLAQEDPTFAVRLIRIANAASSAPATPIVTVRQAVVRIGARECAGLATTIAVSRVFIPKTAAQRGLWIHAVQVAVAARCIARLMTVREAVPDQAYLAGLLHDIGRFVMFEAASGDLSRVDETCWQSPQELLDTERSLLGYDHVALGVLVCKRWSLPDSLVQVVRLHHDYGVGAAQALPGAGLLRVVQMADLLSVQLMTQPQFAAFERALLAQHIARTCVRPEWPRPPVSAEVLGRAVASIRDEAAELTQSLLGAQEQG